MQYKLVSRVYTLCLSKNKSNIRGIISVYKE